jgi:hypothetical protein
MPSPQFRLAFKWISTDQHRSSLLSSSKQACAVQKYWITNSALHAKWSVVFAQLMINGSNEGIHAFLVRIRDEQMRPMPNVRIEDMGHKMGCNGSLSLTALFVTRSQFDAALRFRRLLVR